MDNKNTQPNRRQFMSHAASLGAISTIMTQPAVSATKKAGEFPIKIIASGNGLEAVKQAYELVKTGSDTLDAVIAGVNLVENDPSDMSVGYGGLPNEKGVVELDAAVMHGPTHQAGSVAALQNIKNPSQVAKLVMEQTDHVLLVGQGALQFAKAHGFKEEDLLTEKARKVWLKWKQSLSDKDDWLLPPEMGGTHADPHGTIHCAAMNPNGAMSCVTTTSGLAFKIPGRVGDSPIIGAGLYADNEIGTCGSTGRGEANLHNLCSYAGVELMRNGMSSTEAGLEILRRVANHCLPRLRDKNGRPNFGLNFYLLGKEGDHAGVSMHAGVKFAVADEKGARLEECVSLY